MNKAYTYADFITESMNYQHSQEYYDIMKEMAEIELMSSYLASQQFLAEEAEYYDFTDGVLMEAGDTEGTKTKLGEKAKNLLKKIWEGLKKAWSVFINFIKSIPGKVKGLVDKIKGTKAAESLQFVADKAESDPTNTEKAFNQVVTGKTDSEPVNTDILKKDFKDIINIPDIYTNWTIKATDHAGGYGNILYDFDSPGDVFEEFTKVSKTLSNFINKEGNTVVDVIFYMNEDHNKLDDPVKISYLAIGNIVEYIVKRMSKIKNMDASYFQIKNRLKSPANLSTVCVKILSDENFIKDDFVQGLKDGFTYKMDELLASVDQSVDPEELKYFNEINQLVTWAISEYMTASGHAFKLITDIVKVSVKIKAAYEKRENEKATS